MREPVPSARGLSFTNAFPSVRSQLRCAQLLLSAQHQWVLPHGPFSAGLPLKLAVSVTFLKMVILIWDLVRGNFFFSLQGLLI